MRVSGLLFHDKLKHRFSNLNLVPVMEHPSCDGFLVQHGSIGAVQVFQNEVAVSSFNPGMPPRYGFVLDGDMVLPGPANEGLLGIARILFTSVFPCDDDEFSRAMFLRGLF